MRARTLILGVAGVPLAAAALLGAQVYIAANTERPDVHLAEDITATVGDGGAPVRLVVLGDSTAAGVGALTVAGSLPVLVAERVADTLDRPVDVLGHGVSGARTQDVRADQIPLLAAIDGHDPDVVVVAVGSNDVTHLTPPWTLRERSAALLAEAADAAGGAPVVLAGIPQFRGVGAIPQPLRSIVVAYAGPLRDAQRAAVAEARRGGADVRFVDIAREASPRFAGVPEAMSADEYHPSAVGYGFWADAIAPIVVDAVGDR